MTSPTAWEIALQLLRGERLGVLGTNHLGHAYTSLVAFVATDDVRRLYFATTRATRKYNNLAKDQQVAFLVDNRSRQQTVLYEAAALSAYGQAAEVSSEERDVALALYLDKHPELKTFVVSPSTALFRISITSYHLVQRFQNVTEFRMDG
jgi:heme iron utilization protein